jgi:hypothetical protein
VSVDETARSWVSRKRVVIVVGVSMMPIVIGPALRAPAKREMANGTITANDATSEAIGR